VTTKDRRHPKSTERTVTRQIFERNCDRCLSRIVDLRQQVATRGNHESNESHESIRKSLICGAVQDRTRLAMSDSKAKSNAADDHGKPIVRKEEIRVHWRDWRAIHRRTISVPANDTNDRE
jgi:hypothetical protein